ncbi:MAG: cytochrome b/b6 domain-containing protein [Fluviibacter sp.]
MAQQPNDLQAQTRILVWDIPTRIFHWILVLCFVVAYLTSESERWQLWHVTAGYLFGVLLLFRLFWGVVGSRYARFSQFVRGPRQVLAYLSSLLTRNPEHFTGHNPAGALAIVGILGLGLLTVLTGWASFNDYGDWIGELHEGIVNVLLFIIGIHVGGVLISSVLHRENLVRAMINGHKRGAAVEAIRYPQWVVGVLLLAGLITFLWALLSGHLPWLMP